MPNSNYLSGARFERQLKKEYESKGYLVMRSSGSHGPYDLACFNKYGDTLLIQCKVVAKDATIKQLERDFQQDKPFTAKAFNQLLAVKIKGSKDYITIYAK